MAAYEMDGCVRYMLPEPEPDTQADDMLEAQAEYDAAHPGHARYLCDDCRREPSAGPFARGVCDECHALYRFLARVTVPRVPKPRAEAHAS